MAAALAVNRTQPTWLVDRIARALGGLAGRRVLVLGLAFKPGTDDLRDSIALPLCDALLRQGAIVAAHDPRVTPAAARPLLAPDIVLVGDAARALRDAFDAADAALLVTAWPEYVDELPALLAARSTPLLFVDARGILRDVTRASCVEYLGIGARLATDGDAA